MGHVKIEVAIQESVIWFHAAHVSRETNAVDILQRVRITAGPIDKGRQEVVVDHVSLKNRLGLNPGALHNHRHADAALPRPPLMAVMGLRHLRSHVQGVMAIAVVRDHHDVGVFGDTEGFDLIEHRSDSSVQILPHPQPDRRVLFTRHGIGCLTFPLIVSLHERMFRIFLASLR